MTPPPSPLPKTNYYALGTSGTFSWVPNGGLDDHVISYNVAVRDSANQLISTGSLTNGSNQFTFTGVEGGVYYATVSAVSAAGISSTMPASSDAGSPNPNSISTPVKLLALSGDDDGDGQSNAAEDVAGTNPLTGASVLKITSIQLVSADVSVSVATVVGKKYQLETSTSLAGGSWSALGGMVTATGTSTVFPHPNGSGDGGRFYRARVVP